jgi:hypothetical protein
VTLFAGTGVDADHIDGAAATSSPMADCLGVYGDTAGSLYVTSYNYDRTVKIEITTDILSFFVGTGSAGNNGDGSALTSQVRDPYYCYADTAGRVYVADFNNHAIRKIDGGIMATVAGT